MCAVRMSCTKLHTAKLRVGDECEQGDGVGHTTALPDNNIHEVA
jgi:hypothetical protein